MNTPHRVAVGVLADEGLPEQVMATIADDLPGMFAARVSRETRWRCLWAMRSSAMARL
jgi:hypothetical protein